MKFLIRNEPLREISRLLPSDLSFDPSLVRIKRTNNCDLIFYEDFELLTPNNLTKLILEYNLDPDRVGVVIDEVRVLDHPYILSKTKRVINPSKIYIKPINCSRTTKMIKEGIDSFLKTNQWEIFDNYIHEDSENIENFIDKASNRLAHHLSSEGQKALNNARQNMVDDAAKWGKKAVKYAGGLYITNKTLNYLAKKYAESDAKKPSYLRSSLIAKLRVLKGKSAEYESELSRTTDYKRRSLLGKIIFKIKESIKYILRKLHLMKDPYR